MIKPIWYWQLFYSLYEYKMTNYSISSSDINVALLF